MLLFSYKAAFYYIKIPVNLVATRLLCLSTIDNISHYRRISPQFLCSMDIDALLWVLFVLLIVTWCNSLKYPVLLQKSKVTSKRE